MVAGTNSSDAARSAKGATAEQLAKTRKRKSEGGKVTHRTHVIVMWCRSGA